VSTDADEEGRLLFVAMTRARRLLVLSHAEQRTLWGVKLPGKPSPLLSNLPDSVLRSTQTRRPPDPAASQMELF